MLRKQTSSWAVNIHVMIHVRLTDEFYLKFCWLGIYTNYRTSYLSEDGVYLSPVSSLSSELLK